MQGRVPGTIGAGVVFRALQQTPAPRALDGENRKEPP